MEASPAAVPTPITKRGSLPAPRPALGRFIVKDLPSANPPSRTKNETINERNFATFTEIAHALSQVTRRNTEPFRSLT